MTNFLSLRDKYACPCDESVMYDQFLLPVDAKGMQVWVDGDPEPYLDLVLGYSSVNFGHEHPFIVKAAQEAVTKITQIHSFHTKDKLNLSKYLADKVSKDEDYQVYFDIGGTSVVASALRLCRQTAKKRYVICFEGAYHGAGYLAASVSDDRLMNKNQFGIDNLSEFIIQLPYPAKHNKITTDECMENLTIAIQKHDVAAVIVEPIQGANGFVIPKDDFLPHLREKTTDHGILLIADEIQVGLGRAGRFFSYQKANILPDIVLVSKSLSGGFYPLSAIITRSNLFNTVPERGTAFQSTFNNNPLGINIALKVMELLENENCIQNAVVQGEKLLYGLKFLEDSPYTCNLRGEGLAIAFDFIEKDGSNQQPSRKLAKLFTSLGLKEHVIFYSCGVAGNVIKLAPALISNDQDIELIIAKLKTVFEKLVLEAECLDTPSKQS